MVVGGGQWTTFQIGCLVGGLLNKCLTANLKCDVFKNNSRQTIRVKETKELPSLR